MREVRLDLEMGRASNTQAPVVTYSTSTHPVPPLTGDFNPIIEEEEATNPIPVTGTHSTPAMEGNPTPATEQDPAPVPGDTPIPMDEVPTMRPGSVPLTSDSKLVQLSDTNTP